MALLSKFDDKYIDEHPCALYVYTCDGHIGCNVQVMTTTNTDNGDDDGDGVQRTCAILYRMSDGDEIMCTIWVMNKCSHCT